MDNSIEIVNNNNQLEENLLKSYDKEAVAKLLDKQVNGGLKSAQWGDGLEEVHRPAKRAKKVEGIEEREYLMSKIELLESELKNEKQNRIYYEVKASKEEKNVHKIEKCLNNLKSQLKVAHQQSNTKRLEYLKSKLLVRIGDIEKDTIETKAFVVEELKNIADIKKPLENVNKLVEFLKIELDARDNTIIELEKVLMDRDAKIMELESKPPNGASDRTTDTKDISDLIKCSEDLNSELSKITKCSEVKEEIIQKSELELEEKTTKIDCLKTQLKNLSVENVKLASKKQKLGERYDELERYLTKIEKKLEKKKVKVMELIVENENAVGEIVSLKELNENILEQMNVLKEETKLLRESIAQKDAKLIRTETTLSLSKEELRMDINFNFNNLLKENHKLKIEIDRLRLENCISVKNHKTEVKKERRLHEANTLVLSQAFTAQIEALKQVCKKAETVNVYEDSQSGIVEGETKLTAHDIVVEVSDVSTRHSSTSKDGSDPTVVTGDCEELLQGPEVNLGNSCDAQNLQNIFENETAIVETKDSGALLSGKHLDSKTDSNYDVTYSV